MAKFAAIHMSNLQGVPSCYSSPRPVPAIVDMRAVEGFSIFLSPLLISLFLCHSLN